MNTAIVGNVLYGFDDEIKAWVAQRIPGFVATAAATTLGVKHDDYVVAGIVFERYNGVHVEASIAVDHMGWANKETMRRIFSYPFNQLDCKAVSVTVPSSNIKSLNLATKMGFEPEAYVKFAAHDGSSLVVLKMFRDNCKWIKENGQEFQGTVST